LSNRSIIALDGAGSNPSAGPLAVTYSLEVATFGYGVGAGLDHRLPLGDWALGRRLALDTCIGGVGRIRAASLPERTVDEPSLALGGAIGTVAVIIKQELLLPFIGGVFVIEALSVILQVGSYKLRKKRIFKMAPIHHHFELMGWSESKIIVRFWIASLVFALFALTTLKLR